MTIYCLPTLLSLLSFLSLAGLTLLRGARTRVNRLFFMLCLLAALIYSSFLFSYLTQSSRSALWASRLDHMFIPLLLPLYIAFFQEYLHVTGRNQLIRIAYGYAVMLICLAPFDLYISHMAAYEFGFAAKAGPLYFLFILGEAATTLYVLTLVYQAIGREQSSTRKNRLKYVLVGFGSLGLLNGLNFLTILGVSLYPPGNFSFIPLAVFAVGLFKHDLLDMGFLIKKSLIYSALTALLTCLYAVLIILVNRWFSEVIPSESLLLPVGFFFLITFIFGPMKNAIQRLVDKLFFKGSYDYRVMLKEMSGQIVSELDTRAIGKKVLSTIQIAMKVEYCELYVGQRKKKGGVTYQSAVGPCNAAGRDEIPENDPLPVLLKNHFRPITPEAFIEKAAQKNIPGMNEKQVFKRAVWVFPLHFKEHLNGFLILGEKRSGDLYTREDLDLLETVCSQSALALENAISYQRIDRLNSQLEKKVADRTRALKAALEEKEKTQDQLIRSESLAAIGQLVAGVAHELNNPLASAISLIQSTSEDLKEAPRSAIDETVIDDLAFVEKELNRAKVIVKSLLGLSRQTDTYKERVNLNDVIKDARRILYNQYKHASFKIESFFSDNLPEISGNFATLGQVALNIIQNAIQAVMNRNNGHILLSTRYEAPTGEVVFECTDSGPGISKSIQKDILKPFFTTKEVGQGTGLGLYISHEIIRKHGGSLTFESKPDKGARFMVRLPTAEPESPAGLESDTASSKGDRM